MSTSAPVKSRRPPKELRDQARRDQIVHAARGCVIRHGFHGASMAEIATAARMSVGQIYRYFPNKEAIVHAIVECIVAERLSWILNESRDQSENLWLNRLISGADDDKRENYVLTLEVTAEATRNPAVAQIVREADKQLHGQAVATLRKIFPELSEQDAAARVEVLAVLSEGTTFRRVAGQRADARDLLDLYRDVVEKMLPARPARSVPIKSGKKGRAA